MKSKCEVKVVRSPRKIAIVEHLQARVLYSADLMPGLVSDLQSEIDDTSRSYPLLWGQSRAVSPADNGFGSEADPAVDLSLIHI